MSAGFLKQTGAVQHIRIETISDVYQTNLNDIYQNYDISGKTLMLPKTSKIFLIKT